MWRRGPAEVRECGTRGLVSRCCGGLNASRCRSWRDKTWNISRTSPFSIYQTSLCIRSVWVTAGGNTPALKQKDVTQTWHAVFIRTSDIWIIYAGGRLRQGCGPLWAESPPEGRASLPVGNLLINEVAHPRPTAKMWEMIKEGRKSFRKSADSTPPFFITLLFLMLREVERLGYFSRNSLQRSTWIFHHCGFIEISAGLMSARHRCDRSVIWLQVNRLMLTWEKFAPFLYDAVL